MFLVVMVVAGASARAQPPPCPPPRPQPGIPLQLDLNSLPGAAGRQQVQGSALVVVPAGPSDNCPTPPHLPSDVLHGDPGDALMGEAPRR